MSFTLAIVGRPNVGKSTLFNRLVGKRLALVDDLPGVTRDRRVGRGRLGDLNFSVIDTAGLEQAAPESLTGRMQEQTEAAIQAADAVLFLIDARAGSTVADRAFADLVRRSGKPAIVVANKSENKSTWQTSLTTTSLVSASRSQSRRSTARDWLISMPRSAPRCPTQPRLIRNPVLSKTTRAIPPSERQARSASPW